MSLQGELDQPVDQSPVAQAACLPHARIHADGGEPRDGINLIHQESAGLLLKKKIDAPHASALYGLESCDGELLYAPSLGRSKPGRNDQLRGVLQIFGGIVVEI